MSSSTFSRQRALGRIYGLSLFQQSYKGFRGKFFRVCNSQADPTSLDGFPLYWVKEPKLTKGKTLDELNSADREICQVLAGLGVVFNTTELIKHEYNPTALTKHIGMGVIPSLLTVPIRSSGVMTWTRERRVVEKSKKSPFVEVALCNIHNRLSPSWCHRRVR